MIKVCDAIMGSGKSESAITLMNENPDGRYIYITPYINEAKRIKESCPSLQIVEPKKKSEYHGSKTLHTVDLIRDNCNVATTHQAFKYYPDELLNLIREKEYTLIIDESINVFDKVDVAGGDIDTLVASGCLNMDELGVISLGDREYTGVKFRELFSMLRTRDIVKIGDNYFCWYLPPALFLAAPVVYILTYMFDGQDLSYLFAMNGIEYENIGIEHEEGTRYYHFIDHPGKMPSYVTELPNKIRIFDDEKINSIGDDKFALSMNWYDKERGDVGRMKNNVYNYFHNYMKGVQTEDLMWGVFDPAKSKIKGKGYTNGFVPWNERAKNTYRNKRALAYCVNVFMNADSKKYFNRHGASVNEDKYALSVMVQWIWRSAIRDGEDIDLYIPSSRMRNLLIQWIDDTSKGVRY